MMEKCEWCGDAITDEDCETNFIDSDEKQFFHLDCAEEIKSLSVYDWIEMGYDGDPTSCLSEE